MGAWAASATMSMDKAFHAHLGGAERTFETFHNRLSPFEHAAVYLRVGWCPIIVVIFNLPRASRAYYRGRPLRIFACCLFYRASFKVGDSEV